MLAWITKIDIAYLFAPAIFFISGWEFIFGILGYLNLGMKSLIVFIGITGFVFLIKSADFRSQIVKSLFAPSTFAFVALSLISLYKTKDWLLYIWDEFSHWGVFTKAMYYYDALAPATPVDLWHASYPPGIPLFQYFVMEFNQSWQEGLLFWSMHLLAISVIVAALAKCTYKSPSELLLKLFIALIASSAFLIIASPHYLNIFNTIYQDGILALAFGFTIVVAIKASYLDGRWGIILALSAGFVTFLKPIGIYFAVSAILINIIATVFTVKFSNVRNLFAAFVPSLVSLVTVGASWVTWGNYISRFGINSEDSAGYLNTIRSLTNEKEAISNFISAFFHTKLPSSSFIAMPSSTWTVIFAVFIVIWISLDGYQTRKRNIFIGFTLAITTFGYFFVIFLSYLIAFTPGEAAVLASYDRYIGTWYQGVFFAIVLLILRKFDSIRDVDSNSTKDLASTHPKKRSQVGIFLVTLIAISSISSQNQYLDMLRTPKGKELPYRDALAPVVAEIEAAKIPKGAKVYIITQHKTGYEYYVLRYEMIGAQFGAVPFSIGSPFAESGDAWTDPTVDAEKWSKMLLDFDYVVLSNVTESFLNEFYLLFKDGIVEDNSVYKVVKLNDRSPFDENSVAIAQTKKSNLLGFDSRISLVRVEKSGLHMQREM